MWSSIEYFFSLPCSVDYKNILLAIINTHTSYYSVENQNKFWFSGKVVLGPVYSPSPCLLPGSAGILYSWIVKDGKHQ